MSWILRLCYLKGSSSQFLTSHFCVFYQAVSSSSSDNSLALWFMNYFKVCLSCFNYCFWAMLNPRCCHRNHFNIVAAIDFLLPSNILLTVEAFEPSSAMNFEGLKQDKTKYGRDRFTVLENFDPSRFKFQAVLWVILFKPLVRDPKLRWKHLRSIKEVMFHRGCQLLGLFSLVFLVVKSSDFSGKWFIPVGQFVISASDHLLQVIKTRSSDWISEAFVIDPTEGG